MELRNSNGTELRNFYFTTVQKLFLKIFLRSAEMHHVELKPGTSKSSKGLVINNARDQTGRNFDGV